MNLKSYKTTLLGWGTGVPLVADALLEAYNAGYFTNDKGWQLVFSITWIIFATLTKDHDVTGGTRQNIQGGGIKNPDPK